MNRRRSLVLHWGVVCLVLCLLTSCRMQAPALDYRALVRASDRLGLYIGPKDNHRLYLEAASWIGTPYRAGGQTRRGTDCSGLVRHIYRTVYRQTLPHSSSAQKEACQRVKRRKLREGDLVFFSSPSSRKRVAHVGIYLKNGRFIHASTSRGVIVSSLDEAYYRKHWKGGGRPR